MRRLAVQRGGPAAEAGLRPGDIITEIDGLAATDTRSVMKRIAETRPGTRITLKIIRAGEEMVIEPVIGERASGGPGSDRRG